MADLLTKPIKEMSDAEVAGTETYLALKAAGLGGALSEAGLLAIARTALGRVRSENSRWLVKSEALEFISLCSGKGVTIPENGRLIVYPDGSVEARGPVKAGGSRRFRWSPNDHYPRIIGMSFTKDLQRSDDDKNGEYTLVVNKPLAQRPDVPFSLILTSPNKATVSYPAKKKGNAGTGETDDLMQLVPMSQWQAKIAPHAAFSLHEAETFAADREAAEGDDETEELPDDVGALVEA